MIYDGVKIIRLCLEYFNFAVKNNFYDLLSSFGWLIFLFVSPLLKFKKAEGQGYLNEEACYLC
jgi:hypothetical protein